MSELASPLVLRAIAEIRELKARLDAQDDAQTEPIAILGLGCRFPGADGPQAFRALLQAGRDAIGELPPARQAFTPWQGRGGFLANVDCFDHAFFGISGREAASMDPQQRLLLEVAWEALDDACLEVALLAGSQTGVFIGACTNDYTRLQVAAPRALNAHMGTGGAASVLAGRLSYTLGLQGPALVIDTACSSSLVALHQACQSLRAGESSLALVGGVNLILAPESSEIFGLAHMLAADARCKTFDAAADGYVRGEGCGVVVLKRLGEALRDGDRIQAVIQGSAVNQDGRSTGLTAPNVLAQEALLREAWERAGVPIPELGLIEAHGTGTPLGDPIEVEALKRVLGAPRGDSTPCYLGSVKTNLGHLEGAAGIAGLLKAVLSLTHGEIYPHLHLQTLNPHLSFADTPFEVPRALVPWPASATPRLACVSSFGFSGTNAHVVLAQAPTVAARPFVQAPEVLCLGAKSAEALAELAGRHRAALVELAPGEWHDWCRVAARRGGMTHRLAVVADGPGQAAAALLAGTGVTGRAPANPPGVVFVFGGQGTQYPQMALDWLDDPAFQAEFNALDALLTPLLGWSVQAALAADVAASRLDRTDVAQPALFAVQGALAAVWRAQGILPAAVIGHSVGEVAAAYVAGVLTREAACRVIVERGRVMARPTAPGRMAIAACRKDELEALLTPWAGRVCLAAENAAQAVTVAGEQAAIEGLLVTLAARDIRARDLGVGYAFHSPLMDEASRALGASLSGLAPAAPVCTWYSTLTGQAGAVADGGYWARQVRQPVAFRAAVGAALADGHRVFLELGPDAVLAGPLAAGGREAGVAVTVAAAMRRGEPARRAHLGAIAVLFTAGVEVRQPSTVGPPLCPPLPAYPWQRERAWYDMASRLRPVTRPPGQHAWLERPLLLASQPGLAAWAITLDQPSAAFLADHRILEGAVLPAAAFVELALAAALQLAPERPFVVEALRFEALLLLPDGVFPALQAVATPEPAGGFAWELFASSGETWVRHASCRLVVGQEDLALEPLADARARFQTPRDPAALYAELARRGLHYGPAFRGLQAVWAGAGEALARIQTAPAAAAGFQLHPALLDACLQAVSATQAERQPEAFLPVSVAQVRLHRAADEAAWSHVRVLAEDADGLTADVTVWDLDGAPVATLRGLRLQRVAQETAGGLDEAVVAPVWERAPQLPRSQGHGRWLLVGHLPGLAEGLRERDCEVAVWTPGEAWPLEPVSGVVVTGASAEDMLAGCLGALEVVQALARAGRSPRCFLLTRGAQALDGAALVLAQTPLWGFGRTLALEHPELRPTLIDLSASPDAAELAALVAELLADAAEDALALRHDARYVQRLARHPLSLASRKPGIRTTPATYLITGGLGGLGLELAGWLGQRGAKQLVLLGRSAPTPAVQARLDTLFLAGCEVITAAVDVSDPAALAQVFKRLLPDLPPLAGVFHAAGVVDDAVLLNLTPGHFQRVFAAKAVGALHLHELTRGLDLDHFVLFSSSAALVGSPGQANYAAANAALDGLARLRCAAGLPGLSINWGPWLEVGMAARTAERFGRGALDGVAPALGLALLGRLLREDAPQLAVLPFDAVRLQRDFAALFQAPLMRGLVTAAPGTRSGDATPLVDALRPLGAGDRHAHLVGLLRAQAALVLQTDAERLPGDVSLQALGLDSLMAIDMRGRIAQSLGVEIPMVRLLQGPSLEALASELLGSVEAALVDLESLSEDEADALLAQLLAEAANA